MKYKVMTVQDEVFSTDDVEYVRVEVADGKFHAMCVRFTPKNGYNRGKPHTVPLLHVKAIVENES